MQKGKEHSGEYIFRTVRDYIRSIDSSINPYLALFGCSDEVTGSADAARASVFGGFGGIFTTRIIGSQIFYQQIQIATSRGHRSNVFEVNVHIGEMIEDGHKVYGALVGRDGHKRATCGALANVLDDLHNNPSETPQISRTEDGEVYLDFLGTLKFRLRPHFKEILAAENPVMAITKINLDVQVHDLIHQLQRIMTKDPSYAPMFVYGTIAYNRVAQPDTKSLEHFYALHGDRRDQVVNLLHLA